MENLRLSWLAGKPECGLPIAAAASEERRGPAIVLRVPLPAMAGKFVPSDYFRKLAHAEICRGGKPLELDLGCGDGAFKRAADVSST